MSLKNKSFLKLLDLKSADIDYLLTLAADLKAKKKKRRSSQILRG